MWSTAAEQTLYLGLVLSRLVGEGWKVLLSVGRRQEAEAGNVGSNQNPCEQLTLKLDLLCGLAVKVFCRPGQGASLPCLYDYEDQTNIEQLTMRWTSPHEQLLCHYIKHRNYQNCSTGYTMNYRPGSIKLTIQQVQTGDFGTHVCSVGKPHESSDFSIDLALMTESVTSVPTSGGNQAGLPWRQAVLLALTWSLVCM